MPHAAPATIGSPTFSVPLSTRTVATGPRPTSRLASSTMPLARPCGLAVSSSSSATTSSCSSRSSTPRFCSADISTVIVSPPHDSGTRPCSDSCVHAPAAGSALSRSILLIATTIGTSAALAWLMASIVCGMTPSSAATTSTTMSVTWAPRARIFVKAAWPGRVDEGDRLAVLHGLVGADVLGDATGLAGDDVGRADAVEQQRLAVVDVAHDGDDRRPAACASGSSSSSSLKSAWSSSSCCWPGSTRSTSAPSSRANSSICSSDSGMVAVTISPCWSRKRTTSAAVRFSFGPYSCGEAPRSMMTVPSGTGASVAE